ncbi:spinocerebellar ataxia type 10 protein domain-containing protein [Chytriomyces sp. MP71]|nr:spinocerebellar ataxia type 10 protein domain-containing protein [Chytriomyces sp. MP71]
MTSASHEYAAETEALRLYSVLESIAKAAIAPAVAPETWMQAAESIREVARVVCLDELLRKKLSIIPPLFPLVSSLLLGFHRTVTSTFLVGLDDAAKLALEARNECGYTSWSVAKSATIFTTATLQLVRNLCAAVPEAQILACQCKIHQTLDGLLTHYSRWLKENPSRSCIEIKKHALACIQMGTQTLANMMTSNPIVQNTVWPLFFSDSELFLILFETHDPKTVKYVLLCVYNSIYNDASRGNLLIQTKLGRKLFSSILSQVDSESSSTSEATEDNFDIVYAIFKSLVTILPPARVFNSLLGTEENSPKKQHLNTVTRPHLAFLKLVDADMNANNDGPLWDDAFLEHGPAVVLKVLTGALERFAEMVVANVAAGVGVTGTMGADLDCIVLLLAYFTRVLSDDGAAVTSAVRASATAGMSVTGAVATTRRRQFVASLSVFESVVKFLVVAGKLEPPKVGGVGKSNLAGSGIAAAVTDALPASAMEGNAVLELVRKGLYMMKVDAIKVLSNGSFKCKEAQDEIRRVGGIPIILSHCTIDDSNPFIKEWSVFAIRNLCDGNFENQKLIESMEAVGLPEGQNDGLAAHGVHAGLSADGRVRITPLDTDL